VWARVIAVVLGVSIGLSIWGLQHSSERDEDVAPADTRLNNAPIGTAGTNSTPVADFVGFSRTPVNAIGSPNADYIANGLRKLAGALDSLGIGGAELPLDLRVAAAHVLLRPEGLDIAKLVRDLTQRTATALESAHAGSRRLRPMADSLSESEPVTRQQPALQEFFAAAGEALDNVSDIERRPAD
jgi:hypothetical protein